jgi:hypothetical protein
MFCTVCGTQLRDDVKFCTKCGAKAKIPVMPRAAVPPQASVPPPPVYVPPAPAQKSAVGTVVAVIAVAAVLCVVGMLAFGGDTYLAVATDETYVLIWEEAAAGNPKHWSVVYLGNAGR